MRDLGRGRREMLDATGRGINRRIRRRQQWSSFGGVSEKCTQKVNKFLVSKETVVLRRWERSKQKFGFIKRVDKGEITTVKDLES